MAVPVLSGVGDVLNYYQRNISDPVSGSILLALNKFKMGLGLGDEGSDTLSQFGSGMPGESDPSGALSYAYKDNPLGRFAFQTVTDPLNLVGTGAVPAAAHALGVGGHALEALNLVDKLPHTVVGGAMDTVSGALRGPVMDAAAWAEPHVAAFSGQHPDLAQAWQNVNQGWKSVNHMVPGYPLRNLVDDATRQAAYGDMGTAGDIVKGFPQAVKNTINGVNDPAGVAGQAAQDYLETFGGNLPHAVTDTGVPQSYGGGITSVFRKIPDSPLNPLRDKVAGADEWNKRLELNQEIATRGPVWGNTAVSGVRDRMDMMARWMDRNGASGQTLDDFINSEGMMSPSDLAYKLTTDGMHPVAAQTAADNWRTAVEEASQDAGDYVNKTQFQYRNQPYQDRMAELQQQNPTWDMSAVPTNTGALKALDYHNSPLMNSLVPSGPDAAKAFSGALRDAHAEQVLRGIAQNTFGGYKFATQNVPAFVRLAGEHPVMFNAPEQYYRDSDIYNYQHGLPGRFHGAMPVGGAYFNPAALSSMAELVGAATDQSGGDNGQTGLGEAANTAGELGFGLNPLIRLGLQLTGQMGDKQISDISRPLTAVSGAASLLTGSPQNIEQPLKNLVGAGQQAITGQETFPYQDYLVRRRQAELSGGYNKWQSTQTSGPIHDQANQDAGIQQGLHDLLQTLTPLDVQTITPEAQQIGQNAYSSNLLGARGLLKQAALNPTAPAYALADPLAEKVARFETLSPQDRMALLRDPRALELLQKQRSIQLHSPQALAVG